MAEKLRLMLLGYPQVAKDGNPVVGLRYRKSLALLCFLAVTGRTHSRDALIGLLWPNAKEVSARASLGKALTDLRQRLAPHLTTTRQHVTFNQNATYWLDTEAFETGVKGTSSKRDIERFKEAVELYRSDFMDGFYVRDAPEFEEWLVTRRAWLREMAFQALHQLCQYYIEQVEGERTAGIDYATRLLALEPWREEAHQQLMVLLALEGQRGAALVQFETCRRVLAEELGVEPGPETIYMYEQIRYGRLGA